MTSVEQMESYQRENPQNLPGAVLAVETRRDGPLIDALGEGWAEDTICTIGSMTKTFTATAVLLALEEHGALDVDRPVAGLQGMEVYADDPVKRRIKVRHLLQHTSGMPVFLEYSRPRPPRATIRTGRRPRRRRPRAASGRVRLCLDRIARMNYECKSPRRGAGSSARK